MNSSIDRMRVLDLLERMTAMVHRVESLLPIAEREYEPGSLVPSNAMLALERALYIVVQSMLDIASMLLESRDRPTVDSYRKLIEQLVVRGVLSHRMGAAYVEMASFRNVLAHEYDGLDYERILGLTDHLTDFEDFARDVVAHLDREDGTQFSVGG